MTARSTRYLLVAAALAATVAAGTGAAQAADGTYAHTAGGTVFYPNPVQQTGDESLTDMKDADYPALASAYHGVTLTDLDGSGTLTGRYVRVKSETGKAAQVGPDGNFPAYHRDADQFEQVMGYYWVTTAQAYFRHLGFGVAGACRP